MCKKTYPDLSDTVVCGTFRFASLALQFGCIIPLLRGWDGLFLPLKPLSARSLFCKLPKKGAVSKVDISSKNIK